MITFKRFLTEVASAQPNQAQLRPQTQAVTPARSGGGSLQGAQSGGSGGNWGGSLPKLISILPAGNWFAGSQKRGKVNTASGGVSDHYSGNSNAYACDFGLNSTFKGNKNAATQFCLDVANNAGKNIQSWQPYIGSHLSFNTSDGYRIQIVWLSNVGGNHYDHVHLGVKAGKGAENINMPPATDDVGGEAGAGSTPGTSGTPGGGTSSGEDYTAGEIMGKITGALTDINKFSQGLLS